DATPNVGDVITFTITITNNGPDTATGVEVTDVLPPGLTLVTGLIRRGTFSSTTTVWTVGTLESGASATLLLQARVDSPLAQTNTASVTDVDQFDPDLGNNTASATETP